MIARTSILLCLLLIAWMWTIALAQEQAGRMKAAQELKQALCQHGCPEWVKAYIEKQIKKAGK